MANDSRMNLQMLFEILTESALLRGDEFVRLGHAFRHLRFRGVKVEAGTPLHRWEIEDGLEFRADHLLDGHEAPELEFEPVEVLPRPVFGPLAGPAGAFERIQPQVGDEGHVGVGFLAQPALRLVDEAEPGVVDGVEIRRFSGHHGVIVSADYPPADVVAHDDVGLFPLAPSRRPTAGPQA